MIAQILKWAAVFLALLAACPLRYHYASGNLDGSWAWALNEASRQGLMPGRDIIFTYGPLMWMAVPMETHLHAGIYWQFAFWAIFAALLVWLARRVAAWQVVVAAVCLYAGSDTFSNYGSAGPDLFLEFTVLLSLACALVAGPADAANARLRALFLGIAAALTVLLCFIKLSSAVAALGMLALWPVALFWLSEEDRKAALTTAAALAITIPAGVAAGFLALTGTLTTLPAYVRGSLEVSDGYNVAMSVAEPGSVLRDVLLLLAAFISLTGVLLWRWRGYSKESRKEHRPAVVLSLVLLSPLAFGYKHSIVRADSGHFGILYGTVPILLAILVLALQAKPRKPDWPLAIPLLLIVATWQMRAAMVLTHRSPVDILLERAQVVADVLSPDLDRKLDQAATAALATDVIPELPKDQPIAVFPHESAIARANHIPLRLAPVPQAYAAYTAWLDALCAGWLNDPARAPQRILFEWASIDGRHPLLDVPGWSLELVRHYDWKQDLPNGRLLLERRRTPRFGELRSISVSRHKLTEPIRFNPSQPRIARIRIRMTAAGSLEKLAYKFPPLIAVLSGPSRTVVARVVPSTLANGVMASFEPIDLATFRDLVKDNVVNNPMSEITFSGEALALLNSEAEVEWLEPSANTIRIAPPAPPVLPEKNTGPTPTARIEALGPRGVVGLAPRELVGASCPGYLYVTGWAFDGIATKPASKVWAMLDGQPLAVETGDRRDDVMALSGSRDLQFAGFHLTIPLSRLGEAEHHLQLKIVSSDGASVAEGEQNVRFLCEKGQDANR